MTDTITSQQASPQQPNIFAPIIEPLKSPAFAGYFALLAFIMILSAFGKRRPQLSDARFATPREVKKARIKGLRQIARQVPKKVALQLDKLVLPSLEPAIAVVGKSGGGKTRSFFDPGLKSAIDQGWTNLVFDVKGSLMRKHAAYAHSKGYDVYVFAPGYPYSDALNFCDFMRGSADGKMAEQIGTVLDCNFGEPGAKKDNYFSPQGIALLKLVFMLAKQSPFPDTLMAWKILALDDLAGRLAAAKKYGRFDFGSEINSWIGEASMGLRSVNAAEETAAGIVGSAVTHFQRLIDPSIIPCLTKSTIPLDLPGKQIVFFQYDEEADAATAPLVATAFHLLMKRNLNGKVKRKSTMGVWLDEFGRILFPEIEAGINLYREYGGFFALGYQSDAQIELRYTRAYAEAILSSCGTRMTFNSNHSRTEEALSKSLGEKDIWYDTKSRSYGKNSNRSDSEHVQSKPLVSPQAIHSMEEGEAIIQSPGWKSRPLQIKVPIDPHNDRLWARNEKIWDEEICPILIEQARQRFEDLYMLEVEKSDREVIAEAMLPTAEELKAYKDIQQMRRQSGATV